MSTLHMAEILELPVGEREELDRRLESYRRNPEAVSPWPEVKARILRGA